MTVVAADFAVFAGASCSTFEVCCAADDCAGAVRGGKGFDEVFATGSAAKGIFCVVAVVVVAFFFVAVDFALIVTFLGLSITSTSRGSVAIFLGLPRFFTTSEDMFCG